MGYNFTEIYRDWAHEHSGYWEASVKILPAGEDTVLRNTIFFSIEQKSGVGGKDGYREIRSCACSSFTVDEFLKALDKEWVPDKNINYISVGSPFGYNCDYVSFTVKKGVITQMTVKKLSVEPNIYADKFFGKIKEFKDNCKA